VSKQKLLKTLVLDKVHLDARVHVDATESTTITHGYDCLRDALGRSGVKVGLDLHARAEVSRLSEHYFCRPGSKVSATASLAVY
jgi:hypothetical protein